MAFDRLGWRTGLLDHSDVGNLLTIHLIGEVRGLKFLLRSSVLFFILLCLTL